MTTTALTRGTKVRIERDENRYPARGTWPQFRGRTGTIVDINTTNNSPTEYGISFTKNSRAEYWFKAHELTPLQAANDAAQALPPQNPAKTRHKATQSAW